jgi:hypothetical protein
MLALLYSFGGSLSRIDFQKLLFLYCQELDGLPPYEFIPYQYGPFSFTSYDDRRKLIARGLLANSQDWTLTDEGKQVGRQERNTRTVGFARQHKRRGNALVAETYRRFPYYAINSKMMSDVSSIDESIPAIVDSTRPMTKAGSLLTIGYQNRTLDGYLNALILSGATVLCDVRRNPISRKYGFSKRTLAHSCQSVGIRYEHMRELGIPSTRRRQLDLQSDYDALFSEYRTESLPYRSSEISTILSWLESGESVTLTCFERIPIQCHRHCVAEAVESKSESTLTATHI